MKLSIDCCADGNPKQWICKVLKKKKNGKRFFWWGLLAVLGLGGLGVGAVAVDSAYSK